MNSYTFNCIQNEETYELFDPQITGFINESSVIDSQNISTATATLYDNNWSQLAHYPSNYINNYGVPIELNDRTTNVYCEQFEPQQYSEPSHIELPNPSLTNLDAERQTAIKPVDNNNLQLLTTKCSDSQTVRYICSIALCKKSYTTISGLNSHIKKKHSGSSLYICDECSETFPSTHERTMHKINEHEGRRYQTPKPNPPTESTGQIGPAETIPNSNKKSTNEALLFHKCPNCSVSFNQKIDLTRHIRQEHQIEYPCNQCSKVFYSYDMFLEHKSLHDDSIPKISCKTCDKQFISKRKLKEHSIIHEERTMFKCNVCLKVFLRSQTLQYHRITCKAEYQCIECVDSFVTEEALTKHKLLHRTESFTCYKCNKVFTNQQALNHHSKRHMLRMNYACLLCKESISTRAKFQTHIKNHLETNLKCSVCDGEFQSLVKYGYHKAEMHSIMRPYNCILCPNEFCTRQELYTHLHNHTDLKENVSKPVDENIVGNRQLVVESQLNIDENDNSSSPKIDTCEEIGKEIGSKVATDQPSVNQSLLTFNWRCRYNGCTLTFYNREQLTKHKHIHSLRQYECYRCKLLYYSLKVLQQHIKSCQPIVDDLIITTDDNIDCGPIECTICHQLFENRTVLKFHRNFCSDESDRNGDRIKYQKSDQYVYGGYRIGDDGEVIIKTETEDENVEKS